MINFSFGLSIYMFLSYMVIIVLVFSYLFKKNLISSFRLGGSSFRITSLISGVTSTFNTEFDKSQVHTYTQISLIFN